MQPMDETPIGLKEFLARVEKETSEFKEFWTVNRKENPTMFSPKMSEIEWWELFQMWIMAAREG